MKAVKVFFTAYRAILYIAIAAYLVVAIAPMAIGIKPFIVLSASMEPTIMTGALAYINTKDKDDVAVNDIVAFEEGSGDSTIMVIHRLVEKNPDETFVTKGDNNDNNDFTPIRKSQIKGTVVFNIPYLGYLTSTLQTKKGIIVAVALALIAFVSSYITDSSDENEEKQISNEQPEEK